MTSCAPFALDRTSKPPRPATPIGENPALDTNTCCLRCLRIRSSMATGQTTRLVAIEIFRRSGFPAGRWERSIRGSEVGWAQPQRTEMRTGMRSPGIIYLATCRDLRNHTCLQPCGFAARHFAFPYSLSVRNWPGCFSVSPAVSKVLQIWATRCDCTGCLRPPRHQFCHLQSPIFRCSPLRLEWLKRLRKTLNTM